MMKKITLMFSLALICFCWKTNAQTPPNDNLADAIPLIMGASCTNDFFTNTGATAETDEPIASCFTGATHTVWFSFEAPASGAVEITTDISPGDVEDTQIALYAAPTDLNDLSTLPSEVGCDQDGGIVVFNGTSTYMSVLEVGGLTAGDTYYVQVDGWNGAVGDFCVQVGEETCPDPSNLEVENVSGSSAEISWTENGTAAMWDIELVPSGSTATGTPTAEDVLLPYTASGLTNNTFYEVYVRSDCGGDLSEWVGPVGFTTDCVIFPFCENFDTTPSGNSSNPTIPNCWSFIDSGSGYGYVSSSNGQSFYMYNSSDDSGDYILITPQIANLASGTSVQLTLDVNSSTGQELIVGTLSDPADASTFTAVQTLTATTTDYENFTVVIPSGGGTYVGLKHGQAGTYDSYYIDNICFSGDCYMPTGASASNITTTSAEFDWVETNNPPATSWDVEIVPVGTLPTGVPTATGVTKPYVATGLSPSTNYIFYVRTNCGSGDTSAYVDLPFSTACAPFTTPFCENFDATPTGSSSNPTIPNCWVFIDSGTGYGYVTSSYGQSFYMSNASDTSGDYILVSPPLMNMDVDGIQVSFDVNGAANQDLIVGTISDPTDASTFTLVQTVTMTTTDYESFKVNIPPGGTDMHVAIKHGQNGTYDTNYLENICFGPIPSCETPTALTVTNISGSSADFGWTENNTPPVSLWDVEIVPAGTPPTGTPTAVGVTNPYSATGLSSSTDYVFYVRANCGSGDTSAYANLPFTTLCAPAIPNYTEDFNVFLPNCWEEAGAGSPATGPSDIGNSNWLADEFLNTGANTAVNINLYTTNREDWLISPEIDLSGGSYQLVYTVAVTDFANSNAPDGTGMGSDDEVQVLITEDNGATWTNLKTYDQANFPSHTGDIEFVDLSTYTGTVKIAFWATDGSVDDSEDYDFFIDDFKIMTPANCSQPSDVSVSNITASSADIDWTENNTPPVSSWDIEVVPTGTAPTGTPTFTGVTNPFTLTGLTGCETYIAYVRANCGGGDLSWYAASSPFTTMSGPVGAFSENFDFIQANSLPTCWTNIIISNSSATAEADDYEAFSPPNTFEFYSSSDASSELYAITPELVDLSSGTYQMRFQAKGDGVLEIGTMSDPTDETTFRLVETLAVTASYQQFIVPFTQATTDSYIAFRSTFIGTSDYNQFDDVYWEPIPNPCPAPSAISVSNLTTTGADISWTAGGSETEWEIEYGMTGFVPGTGTVVADTDGTLGESLTGLSPLKDYDVYVTAICSTEKRSAQIGPVLFTTMETPCPAVTNVSIVDTGNYSFHVTWDAGGAETMWKIEFGPVGFTPGTGTIVIDDDGVGEIITGLTPDTDYEVYITALCGEGSATNENGPQTFETMGVSDQALENFSFYPNPVTNQLSLRSTRDIEQVVIFDLLGRQVLKVNPNSIAPTLELSNLQTGTYLMRVSINGLDGVYKIIKE